MFQIDRQMVDVPCPMTLLESVAMRWDSSAASSSNADSSSWWSSQEWWSSDAGHRWQVQEDGQQQGGENMADGKGGGKGLENEALLFGVYRVGDDEMGVDPEADKFWASEVGSRIRNAALTPHEVHRLNKYFKDDDALQGSVNKVVQMFGKPKGAMKAACSLLKAIFEKKQWTKGEVGV